MTHVRWSEVPRSGHAGGPGPWEVYALVDPRDEGVRYVGVTSAGLEKRLRRHLLKPSNAGLRAWFAELAGAGARPEIRTLESGTTGWARAERHWIAWFRARGVLCNVDPGGECRGRDGRLRGGIRALGRRLVARAAAKVGRRPRPRRPGPARRDWDEEAAGRARAGSARSLSPAEIAAISATLRPPKEIREGQSVVEKATRTWWRDSAKTPVVSADVLIEEARRERGLATLSRKARALVARAGFWSCCSSCNRQVPFIRGDRAVGPARGFDVFHAAGCMRETAVCPPQDIARGPRKPLSRIARNLLNGTLPRIATPRPAPIKFRPPVVIEHKKTRLAAPRNLRGLEAKKGG